MNIKILNWLILMTVTAAACAPQTVSPPAPTPTLTESPTPAFTETVEPATQTPTPVPTAGASVKLTDPVGGFELTLPPGWVGVMIDPESIARAKTENPALAKTLEYIHQTGQGLDRAYLYDPDPADLRDGFNSHVLVYFFKNGLIGFLPMSTVVQQAGEQLRRLDSTMTITSSSTTTTASGMELGILEASEPYRTPAGATLNLYDKIVIFRTGGGAAIIFLRVHPDMKSIVLPLFDRMIEDIRQL
jgi:hypothetical protein